MIRSKQNILVFLQLIFQFCISNEIFNYCNTVRYKWKSGWTIPISDILSSEILFFHLKQVPSLILTHGVVSNPWLILVLWPLAALILATTLTLVPEKVATTLKRHHGDITVWTLTLLLQDFAVAATWTSSSLNTSLLWEPCQLVHQLCPAKLEQPNP